ncbi:MAG: Hpt domain-containing protein [Nitrospirales bacterium]
MDDYLSKPMHTEKLERMYDRWPPKQSHRLSIQVQDTVPAPTSPSPQSVNLPTVNAHTLKELEELGGCNFLQSMTEKCIEDALQCVTLIEQTVDTHNTRQIQEAAHGLTGIARNMGTGSLAELTVHIETTGKTGDTVALTNCESKLQHTFNQTRRELESILRES